MTPQRMRQGKYTNIRTTPAANSAVPDNKQPSTHALALYLHPRCVAREIFNDHIRLNMREQLFPTENKIKLTSKKCTQKSKLIWGS